MLSSLLTVFPVVFGALVAAAQSTPTVVCVAGQCLQGYTNTTIGATLSSPGSPVSVLLLPGQYDTTTDPQLLHTFLTSSSTKVSPSPGFSNGSSIVLPLTLALQPGLSAYPQANFSGSGTFTPLPETNASISSSTFSAGSIMLASNVWAAVSSSSSSTQRVILWDSIPDLAQVSTALSSSLSILEMQSAACSPPCSGAGICSAAGTCSCPTGFTGSSCESCASGFFGPNCQACPAGCASCDEGITGTGRCLVPLVANPSSSCDCLNGECGSNGQCTCNPGWTTAANGTACAKCASGFFLSSDGNCQVCQLGCTQCADGTGDCVTCQTEFTINANDATKCIPAQTATSNGTTCPDGSFLDTASSSCSVCSPLCQTCSGATSNDCIICGAGKVSLNGACVSPDGNGICPGSTMIADNNKHECDSCPAKCTSCKIPNFNVASTVNQLQCTGCLPGFVLSQGQCVENCPVGTFLSPQDNLTCTACDSTCGTCTGSSTFCLTCANNQLASGGTCVASCPSNTFSASGACLSCHPDCATCSGSSFNQCSSCPTDRPVLTSGRCLPTCSKNQFFDKTSSSCQSCDASCSSCSAAGPSNCLACASSSQVLRSGTCSAATCTGGASVLPGLGVCLSDLVAVPGVASGTTSLAPLPTVSGINTPTSVTDTSKPRTLTWWEILLMALGCAFIFMMVLMCWRRQARKKRAQATAKFAVSKRIHDKTGWRLKLVRFGERLFGHKPMQRVVPPEHHYQDFKMEKMRAAEEARHERDMDGILDAYDYSRPASRRSVSTRAPSAPPTLYDYERDTKNKRLIPQRSGTDPAHNRLSAASLSAVSMYSQVTGLPRRTAEPRQPVRNARDLLPSRFSGTSYSTSTDSGPAALPPVPPVNLMDDSRPPTPAQEYARLVAAQQPATMAPPLHQEFQYVPPRASYWLQPAQTGATNVSRNPFLRP